MDFDQVLRHGTELLGSGGTEYEYDETLDPQQRLENQKKLLEKRMGVTETGIDDMIDAKDFITPNKVSLRES